MALANVGQSALSLASAVRVDERLLEDLCIGTGFGRLDDFLFGGIRVDDEVLATLLFLNVLAELGLDGLVVVDCFANATVEGVDLSFVARVSRLRSGLDSLHAVGEATVGSHDLGTHSVNLFITGGSA